MHLLLVACICSDDAMLFLEGAWVQGTCYCSVISRRQDLSHIYCLLSLRYYNCKWLVNNILKYTPPLPQRSGGGKTTSSPAENYCLARRRTLQVVVSSLLTECGFESAEKAAVESLTEMIQSCTQSLCQRLTSFPFNIVGFRVCSTCLHPSCQLSSQVAGAAV